MNSLDEEDSDWSTVVLDRASNTLCSTTTGRYNVHINNENTYVRVLSLRRDYNSDIFMAKCPTTFNINYLMHRMSD